MIGSWGEAWLYYPPMNKVSGGEPMTVSDVVGPYFTSHDLPFVEPNLPWVNTAREVSFTKPYPDTALAGTAMVTCSGPVYFTGRIANTTYNDTCIASTGLDIELDSVSRLLDILTDKMTKGSFAF